MDRMACINLPVFMVQLLLRRFPAWKNQPVAVVDVDKPQGTILQVNERAFSFRILPGMRYAAGLALDGSLRAAVVSKKDVNTAIAFLSNRLRSFSPRVEPAIDEPNVFWLDAGGLGRLYGSLNSWTRRIQADMQRNGFRVTVVVGFNRFGTYALAKARQGLFVLKSPHNEQVAAKKVPIHCLALEPNTKNLLEKLGIHTVDQFVNLPSGGILKRFGPKAHLSHQLASGALQIPLQSENPQPAAMKRLTLDYPEVDIGRIMAVIQRMLKSLLQLLADRGHYLTEVQVWFQFDRIGTHMERIRPATPTLNARQVLDLILLAMNGEGYGNLCRLITIGRRRSEKGKSRVSWQEVCEHAANLIALWGGDRCLLTGNAEPFFIVPMLRDAFEDRLYALATRHRRAQEPGQEERLRMRARRYRLPVVAAMEVLYHLSKRRPLQDVLTCIRHRIKLVDAGCLTKPNSAVCYCLGITAVDPVQLGLLFERFLSRERAEPPDIDLDIEHDRREEVIQHVYRKYGRSHAAMVANYIRYRPRSAVREVGKVLGIPETALDRLSKMLLWYGPIPAEALEQAGLDPQRSVYRHLLHLANEIQDFPRHLSIHSGGFLLGHEPVHTLVPVENATMPDRTVIQWDKDSLENLGLFKVDLLGLGALRQLHLGFDLMATYYGKAYSMASIPKEDPRTFDMICKSDTVGVFQIESRAQMSMLPRLKPRRYYDLVIEVSIVRPGPITGGMVHPYLRRREGLEPVVYPHPSLEPVLEKTLGVPLFHEQVIRLAMVAADYTPGEADQLRRDMAAWGRSGRIERHRERLIERMMAKGISRKFAERVFDQIRGFGEYGFPESHAASFALIAYATAWMKCYYPEVFACALLNAMPMGFYSPATIVEDARRHRVEVRPLDAQQSHWDCTLEPTRQRPYPFAIRMGLRYLKGFGKEDWHRIEQARKEGMFTSADDLVTRTGLKDSKLTRLAEAGAMSGFEDNRRAAIWQVKGLVRTLPSPPALKEKENIPVFGDLDAFNTIGWDYQTMAHSTHGHPLAPLRKALCARKLPDARGVNHMHNGEFVRYVGMVICRQRPGTAGGVVFLTLEDETGFVNVVIRRNVFQSYALLIKTSNFLGVSGKLQNEDGVVHVVADSFWDPHPQIGMGPASGGSHDFH